MNTDLRRAVSATCVALLLSMAAGCGGSYGSHPYTAPKVEVPRLDDSIVTVHTSVDLGWLNGQVASALPDPLVEASGAPVTTAINVAGQVSITRLVPREVEEFFDEEVCTGWARYLPICIAWETVQRTRTVVRQVEETILQETSRHVDLATTADYRVWRTGSSLSVEGTTVRATLQAKARARLNAELRGDLVPDFIQPRIDGVMSCGYGEEPPEFRGTLVARASVLPDGKLRLEREGWEIDWLRPCLLTAAQINVETLLGLPGIKEAFLKEVETALDRDVAREHDLRAELEKAWNDLLQPVALDPPANQIWLSTNPIEASLSGLGGTGTKLHATVQVLARPQVTVGERPAPSTAPLRFSTTPRPATGVRVLAEARLQYQEAETRLRQALAENPPQGLELREPRVFSDGQRLFVGVEILRPVKARVLLAGTPNIAADTLVVSVPDLDYVAEFESKFIGATHAALQPLLRDWLRREARYSAKLVVNDALLAATNQPLPLGDPASPVGFVSVSNLGVAPLGLYAMRDELLLHAALSAEVAAELGTPPPI